MANRPPMKQIMKKAKMYREKGESNSKALRHAWADAKKARVGK
jgi:hypothetical protein